MNALLDTILCLLSLGLAVWTVTARDNLSSVCGFSALGLLLAVIWVRLGAPDVALTEAAIGGGASGVLFLGVAARLGAGSQPIDAVAPGRAGRVAAGILCGSVTVVLGVVVTQLAEPARSLAPDVAAALPRTALTNPVAGVLLGFRALDTLLEAVVLVLVIVAVWSLAPDRAWGGRPCPWGAPPPDGPLRLLARLLPPIGIVIGIHLAWVGAKAPGGAFQGGTVLAAMWLLAVMAGLARPPSISSMPLRLLLIVGPALFIVAGFAGWLFADAFLAYPPTVTKPVILAIEAALTASIAAALAMLIAGPPSTVPDR
jgi:multisubunit Na+/H+ antiporter MnhB subunit